MPVLQGDLIFTGTPEGVGECKKGDKFLMSYVTGPFIKPYEAVL